MTVRRPEPDAIPEPLEGDDDDVAWALQTAAVQWRRAAYSDAIVWLRRAADSAEEVAHADRSVSLRHAADRLSKRLQAPSEPPLELDVDEPLRSPPLPSFSLPSTSPEELELEGDDSPNDGVVLEIDENDQVLLDEDLEQSIRPPGSIDWDDDGAEPLPLGAPPTPLPPPEEPPLSLQTSIPPPPPRPPPPREALPPRPSVGPPRPPSRLSSRPPPKPSPRPPPPRQIGPADADTPNDSPDSSPLPAVLTPQSRSARKDVSESVGKTAAANGALDGRSEPKPVEQSPAEQRVSEPEPTEPSVADTLAPPEASPSQPETEPATVQDQKPAELVAPAEMEREETPQEHVAQVPVLEPVIDGVSLLDVQGLQDLPDEAQLELVRQARVEVLQDGDELGFFAVALVLEGTVDIVATLTGASCAKASRGDVVFTVGTLEQRVDLGVVASDGGARVATFSKEALDAATAECPWVAEDLCQIGNRFQALAGVTLGPLGDRLDDSLRFLVTNRAELRTLGPGDVVVEQGKPVGGMHIVGGGRVLVGNEELGPGDFVFPAAVLMAGPAPEAATAGPNGALLLVVPRHDTHELLVSVPPLIEILVS